MKIKNLLFALGSVATTFSLSVSAGAAGSNIGMFIAAEDVNSLNSQEKAAALWFTSTFSDGVIITPSTLSKVNHETLDAIWVNADRFSETLPAEFNNASAALSGFVKDGGNLLLTKHATLMISSIGRVNDSQKPNIVSAGEGGNGTDVWNVNAYIGSWQINPDNTEPDFNQIYDRRGHAIYAGLTEFPAYSEWNNCPHPAYPLEGTGNGSEMWREDHNCLWDLNAVSMTADGINTVEKYQNQNNCVVLGTWGHVQDYAVAGIIEYNPNNEFQGRVIANGLAAYEWAPRSGVNAYHGNIVKLTENSLLYLAPERMESGVTVVEANGNDVEEFYTIEGVKVSNPGHGLFIKVKNGKAVKVIL